MSPFVHQYFKLLNTELFVDPVFSTVIILFKKLVYNVRIHTLYNVPLVFENAQFWCLNNQEQIYLTVARIFISFYLEARLAFTDKKWDETHTISALFV